MLITIELISITFSIKIDITKNKDIIIYNINFEKHSNEYNFYNPQELVDEFLFNVKTRFKPKNKFFFKGDFSIENIQNAPLISSNISVTGVQMFTKEFILMILLFLKYVLTS